MFAHFLSSGKILWARLVCLWPSSTKAILHTQRFGSTTHLGQKFSVEFTRQIGFMAKWSGGNSFTWQTSLWSLVATPSPPMHCIPMQPFLTMRKQPVEDQLRCKGKTRLVYRATSVQDDPIPFRQWRCRSLINHWCYGAYQSNIKGKYASLRANKPGIHF